MKIATRLVIPAADGASSRASGDAADRGIAPAQARPASETTGERDGRGARLRSVLYQIPGDIARGPLGPAELDRRLARLQAWAAPGTHCLIADAPGGPFSIESAADEARCVAPTLDALDRRIARAAAAARSGGSSDAASAVRHADAPSRGSAAVADTTADAVVTPDAIIIGCFGDPGLPAFRERYDVPIVGPFEASVHIGAQLGRRVGVVTMVSSVMPTLEHVIRGAGLSTQYAGAAAVEIGVLDLPSHMDTLPDAIIDVGQRLVRERDADVLVLGCMSLAFLGLAEIVGDRAGVPLLNPARCALATAESLIGLGVRPSRRAYPRRAAPDRVEEVLDVSGGRP